MADNQILTPAGHGQRRRLAFLFRDSAIYGIAAAINKSLALITFPLLARHFSVDEYGVLDFFLVLGSFLSLLFVFGQDSAVARYFYVYEEIGERRQVISQSLLFQMAALFLLIPTLWLSADWLQPFLIETNEGVWMLKILLLQLPFQVAINFSMNLLKWTFARTKFLVISIGSAFTLGTLVVLAVMVFDTGLRWILLVPLVTNAVFGMVGLFFVRDWLTLPSGFGRLREMLPYAIPYGVISALSGFDQMAQRTLTYQLLGTEDLGLYGAGAKIALLTGLVVNAFQIAWGPFSLSIHKHPNADVTYGFVLKGFVFAMCVLVFGLGLVAQPLVEVLASDRYSGAAIVVIPLAMGQVIQATSWITEIGISISKRSYLHLLPYVVCVVAPLSGILLLVPIFGLLGVGLGALLGHIAKALLASWLAQRAYPLPWQYGPVIVVYLLTALSSLSAIWLGENWGYPAQAALLILGASGIFMLSWLYLLNNHERCRIKKEISNRIQQNFARNQ